MKIITEDDFEGLAQDHPWSAQFMILRYAAGGISMVPNQFFRDWLDQEARSGTFHIGRCSGIGVGSLVKYDSDQQCLRIGRYVSGGLRLRFLLNGQHESRTISSYLFSIAGAGLRNADPPQYPDTIVKNDVWIGDEMMMLGGGVIENGCVIGARSLLPPNFRTEPFGVYAGVPARLLRFRFPEIVRRELHELAWWDMPLSWIRQQNDAFLMDLTLDEGRSLEVIAELKHQRQVHGEAKPSPS